MSTITTSARPDRAKIAETLACAIIPGMSEPMRPEPPVRPLTPLKVEPADDKMLCERCGAEMYRMHAVWRCPSCGFKTDCCGW